MSNEDAFGGDLALPPKLKMPVQERGRWVFIVAFSLSLALLWYARVDACVSSLFTWLGLLPMQVISHRLDHHFHVSLWLLLHGACAQTAER